MKTTNTKKYPNGYENKIMLLYFVIVITLTILFNLK